MSIQTIVIAVVTSAVVGSSAAFFVARVATLSLGNAGTPQIDQRVAQRMMRDMMAVDDEAGLPLRTPRDRVATLASSVVDGVREFQLTAEPIRWEYADGRTILAWGYNGQIPGPEIRVTEGERVRFVFMNRLPKATTVHWHGLDVPNSQDGVPGLTQEPVAPGATFTYEFVASPAGTHFYHTHGSVHGDEAQQLDMGLSGAFIVEPRGYERPSREFTLVLDEWQVAPMGSSNGPSMANMAMGGAGHSMAYNLYTVNGRSFPATEPLEVAKGDRVRMRLINGGTSTTHPMHLHGHQFRIVAVDGNAVPSAAQLTRNTVTLHPGETYDVEFVAENPGVWLFHCHELHHADGGMIVPLRYEGFAMPVIREEESSAPAGVHRIQRHL
ncbi:MAG: copper oxidase [bacterium]|nr:copper oxidase [bacterium]